MEVKPNKKLRPRDILWQRAQAEIAAALTRLRAAPRSELERLIDTPEQTHLQEESHGALITAWARRDSDGRLGVVVEARERRFGGIMNSVSADGFYLQPDGSTQSMREEELWDHGY